MDLHSRLGLPSRPVAQRLETFFTETWVVRSGGLDPLIGEVESVTPRRRVKRDEIAGEPLSVKKGEGEPVVFVVLRYPLETRPESLSFKPPAHATKGFVLANIGFVVYHRGVPVNDFRYLGAEEVLDLDWQDPWFSRFRNRNLWRRYDAPISAFLYVDHFEVRKEIVLRPIDLQRWVDLGLEGRSTIPVEMQEELKRRVVVPQPPQSAPDRRA